VISISLAASHIVELDFEIDMYLNCNSFNHCSFAFSVSFGVCVTAEEFDAGFSLISTNSCFVQSRILVAEVGYIVMHCLQRFNSAHSEKAYQLSHSHLLSQLSEKAKAS
jgi:hypothetical protein